MSSRRQNHSALGAGGAGGSGGYSGFLSPEGIFFNSVNSTSSASANANGIFASPLQFEQERWDNQQSLHHQQEIQRNPSLFKTELCKSFFETGHCRYKDKCQFAHGFPELRQLSRHPKYKTTLCKTYHAMGACPYGVRCHFIHELYEMQQLRGVSISVVAAAAAAAAATVMTVNAYVRGISKHFASITNRNLPPPPKCIGGGNDSEVNGDQATLENFYHEIMTTAIFLAKVNSHAASRASGRQQQDDGVVELLTLRLLQQHQLVISVSPSTPYGNQRDAAASLEHSPQPNYLPFTDNFNFGSDGQFHLDDFQGNSVVSESILSLLHQPSPGPSISMVSGGRANPALPLDTTLPMASRRSGISSTRVPLMQHQQRQHRQQMSPATSPSVSPFNFPSSSSNAAVEVPVNAARFDSQFLPSLPYVNNNHSTVVSSQSKPAFYNSNVIPDYYSNHFGTQDHGSDRSRSDVEDNHQRENRNYEVDRNRAFSLQDQVTLSDDTPKSMFANDRIESSNLSNHNLPPYFSDEFQSTDLHLNNSSHLSSPRTPQLYLTEENLQPFNQSEERLNSRASVYHQTPSNNTLTLYRRPQEFSSASSPSPADSSSSSSSVPSTPISAPFTTSSRVSFSSSPFSSSTSVAFNHRNAAIPFPPQLDTLPAEGPFDSHVVRGTMSVLEGDLLY